MMISNYNLINIITQNDLIKNMNMGWLLGNFSSKEESTTYSSSYKTQQIQQITNFIMEGMIAKERLTHALTLMNKKQLLQMEDMWSPKSDDNVAHNTRTAIASILEAGSIISEILSRTTGFHIENNHENSSDTITENYSSHSNKLDDLDELILED